MAIKVMTIFGTRPEAIKLAPVIQQFNTRSTEFESAVVVTAQHREMLDQVLDLFQIKPLHDLDLMEPDQTLSNITSRVLSGLEPILRQEQPDWVIVQGDTTSAMAAALAACYQKVRVAHVEAGLRTFDRLHPFPEEMNRLLVTRLADYHFAPTQAARLNLLAEGIPDQQIFVTGNTVVDALLLTIREDYVFQDPLLAKLDFHNRRVILTTTHRRENWGQPIVDICHAIRRLVETFPDVEVVYSVHLNPVVQQDVRRELESVERVHLLPPLEYEPFVQLMSRCQLILTDSGGIQEEAPSLGLPVLVLRNVTERPEGVAAGILKVIGTDTEVILRHAKRLLSEPKAPSRKAHTQNPYGDGAASRRIADKLATVHQQAHAVAS